MTDAVTTVPDVDQHESRAAKPPQFVHAATTPSRAFVPDAEIRSNWPHGRMFVLASRAGIPHHRGAGRYRSQRIEGRDVHRLWVRQRGLEPGAVSGFQEALNRACPLCVGVVRAREGFNASNVLAQVLVLVHMPNLPACNAPPAYPT